MLNTLLCVRKVFSKRSVACCFLYPGSKYCFSVFCDSVAISGETFLQFWIFFWKKIFESSQKCWDSQFEICRCFWKPFLATKLMIGGIDISMDRGQNRRCRHRRRRCRQRRRRRWCCCCRVAMTKLFRSRLSCCIVLSNRFQASNFCSKNTKIQLPYSCLKSKNRSYLHFCWLLWLKGDPWQSSRLLEQIISSARGQLLIDLQLF